jgi:hypothetical protein
MERLMAVLLDGIAQIEYDRGRPLPHHQGAYLDKMDRKMDAGIEIDGRRVPHPDRGQRAQFVAANLAHAIVSDDEAVAAAMTTYLAVRFEDLKQVKITDQGGAFAIELDFESPYVKQLPIRFDALKKPDG